MVSKSYITKLKGMMVHPVLNSFAAVIADCQRHQSATLNPSLTFFEIPHLQTFPYVRGVLSFDSQTTWGFKKSY